MKVHFVVWNIKNAQRDNLTNVINNLKVLIEDINDVDKHIVKENIILVLVECGMDNAQTIADELGKDFKVVNSKGVKFISNLPIQKEDNNLWLEYVPVKKEERDENIFVDANMLKEMLSKELNYYRKKMNSLSQSHLFKAMYDCLTASFEASSQIGQKAKTSKVDESFSKTFLDFCRGENYLQHDENITKKLSFVKLMKGDELIMLICAVHFYSKIEEPDSYKNHNGEMVNLIHAFEKQLGEGKLLVTGDFNTNPHEDLLYGNTNENSDDLILLNKFYTLSNSLMFDHKISPQKSIFNSQHYFYNPCWNLLGDKNNLPNYTFLRKKLDANEKHLNLLDGVIMRKDLVKPFQDDKLEIIDTGDKSDHFPLIFEFKFSE